MNEIVTERLVLRLLQPADAPAFAAYRSDPDVAEVGITCAGNGPRRRERPRTAGPLK
jgi:hypothetical protein